MSNFEDRYPPPPRADASPEDYVAIREGLIQADYRYEKICEYFHVESLSNIFEGGLPEEFETTIASPLAALCQVFLLGRTVSATDLRNFLGEPFVASALNVGLFYAGPAEDGKSFIEDALTAAVALYPLHGIFVASDRVASPPGYTGGTPSDVVYPAVTYSAGKFLEWMPRQRGGRFLEVCAGCGPAALIAAGFAASSISADIAPRSVAFSEFNARLASLENFRGHTGSFYEGLEPGFDLIAAHPPYMPADDIKTIYYSGGVDGTSILEGLVRGLPGQLNPGGIFYSAVMIPASRNVPTHLRLRQWLGEASGAYDVFTFPLYSKSLHEMAHLAAAKLQRGIAYRNAFRKRLEDLGHEEYEYGAVIIRRCREGESAVTIRRQLTAQTNWRHLLWCMEWENISRTEGCVEQFLESPIKARPAVEVKVTNRIGEGGLEPFRFQVASHQPFAMESEIQGWMMHVFDRANKPQTVRQLFESLLGDGMLHPETPVAEFAQLLGVFVAGGFLESPICPVPSEVE